ncbi:MAG: RNA-binding S4 domain-containing protein [Firmicutes bacterium]|nr:RNA-binding S4 domain-containing protein [Bacillota bacterium]MBQ3198895.1 RNA-binding S4 domain-containing protein [Bacillota bacterium]
MRLDKFLKVSRLIKRRTVAKDVSGAGKILINGRPAKAATDVKVGDKLTLLFGRREVELEVLEIAETKRADQAADMYRILREETVADEDKNF